MKKILLVIICTVICMGCDGPKKISGKDFESAYDTRMENTMYTYRYLGEKDGKVYMEYYAKKLFSEGWRSEIHYAEVKSLDPLFYEELKRAPIESK